MRIKAFLTIVSLTGALPAFAQALPQSTPSSDWAAFSADAGSGQPAPAAATAPQPAAAAPVAPLAPQPLSPPIVAPTETAAPMAPAILSEKTVLGPLLTPGTADDSVGDVLNTRLTSSLYGPVGLYKVLSAEPGTVGVVRLGLTGSFFTNNNFPVQQANDTSEVGTLTLAFTPLKYLDVYLGTQVAGNDSTGSHGTSPAFVSELGDFWGGVKLGFAPAKGFGLGLDLRGQGYSGIGTNSLGAGAFLPTAIFTLDANELARFPLRFHVNFGGRFGDFTDLGVRDANGTPLQLRAPEQFALGASVFNTELRGALGVEFPLPYVTPFVEYNMIFPVGAGTGTLLGPDQLPVTYASAFPNDLDFGLRVTAIRDLSFLVGADISFQQNVALGMPLLAPWELFLGLSYNIDAGARSKVTLIEHATKVAEVPVAAPPSTGIVNGTVLDQDTKSPIAGALVQATQAPGLVATDNAGHFQTHALPPGPIDLMVTKDGYKPASSKALVVGGQPATLEVLIERDAKPAAIKLSVHGGGKPLAASVSAAGPNAFAQETKAGDDGQALLAVPATGSYTLRIAAEGFLATLKKVDVAPGAATAVDVDLRPAPKKTVLIVTAKKIKLRRQIHFAAGEAAILTDSTPILDEFLDFILTHGIQRLRIEGHTDNVGSHAKNQQLSQDRADSVMRWLVEHGLSPDKVEAVGYGDTKPVAPNLTSRGKAANRRVEFDLL